MEGFDDSSLHLSLDFAGQVERMTDADMGDPTLLDFLDDIEVGPLNVPLPAMGEKEAVEKDTASTLGLLKRKASDEGAEEPLSKKQDLGDPSEAEARREPPGDTGAAEMIPFLQNATVLMARRQVTVDEATGADVDRMSLHGVFSAMTALFNMVIMAS